MSQKYVGLAVAAGVTFAVYHFSKNTMVKTAALGVLGTIVAKQLPYVQDALA